MNQISGRQQLVICNYCELLSDVAAEKASLDLAESGIVQRKVYYGGTLSSAQIAEDISP